MPVIALVGGVGVGKTYWGRKLNEEIPSAVFIEEDTTKNMYLNEFYSDMHKWGFHSRISMLAMVLSTTADAYSQNGIVILDRIVDELIVFATKEYEDGNLTEKEFALYKQLYHGILKALPRPDVFVYFRCKPQTAYQRIHQRGRDCEKGVSLAFCEDVIRRYDIWRNQLVSDKVLDIDTDHNLDISQIIHDIFALANT